jgi:hypothetical protein
MKYTWRVTKSLTSTNSNIPPLTINGKIVTETQEKVDAFADTLEQIFTTNSDTDRTFRVSTEQVVNVFLKQPLTDRIRATNYSEVSWFVRHLKPRKAADPDGIQNIILQHVPRLVFKCIAKLFNRLLTLNYFPIQWKEAKIIMLPEPGKDHTSPLNYRPISLLNSLGKLFEKIILKRLNFELRKLKALRNDQYGFKRGHSKTHSLLRNAERIMHVFNNNKATVILFLDVERAFDNIWTTGLIAKLTSLHSYNTQLSPELILFCNAQNFHSSLRPNQAGVPQDTLLGPTVFNMYINDIPTVENDSNIAMWVYADDTNISVWSGSIDIAVRKLNSVIGLLEPSFRKWRIKITTKNAQLHCFLNDCDTTASVRMK